MIVVWLWVAVAFTAGAVCWHFASTRIVKNVLRRGGGRFAADLLAGLTVASLLRLQRAINAELDKRRTELNA